MSVDIALIRFGSNAETYEAFSKLKNNAQGAGLESMALISKNEQGAVSLEEGTMTDPASGTFNGSLIGMLVGVLAGPLGMLLGWATGAAAGSLVDADNADESDAVVARISKGIPAGGNAIIAEVEHDSAAVTAIVTELGGTIVAVPREEVIDELESEENAREEAAEAARQAMRVNKREERHEKFESRLDQLREKLHLKK